MGGKQGFKVGNGPSVLQPSDSLSVLYALSKELLEMEGEEWGI